MSSNKSTEKIHRVVLDIYAEFQRICEKYSLKYIAISGTTLGAVLWKGFIPWDDDMDIAMPAGDYIKFEKICKKELKKRFGFDSYLWFGGKIFDRNTTFTDIHYLQYPERFTGVFIDIVPLIGLPDKDSDFIAFMDDFRNYNRISMVWDRYRLDCGFSEKELIEWRNKILLSNNLNKVKHAMDFSDLRYVLDADGFLNPIIMDFENTTIPVSSNYEKDLKIQYGKYVKYPPKEKRQSAHDGQGIFSLEKSCAESSKIYSSLSSETKTLFEKRLKLEAYYCDEMFRVKNENIIMQREIDYLTSELKEIKNSKVIKAYRKVRSKIGKLL